jgi:hypothetical protein
MLSRTALEHVLARAAELQNADVSDSTDGISETRLLEIAREVGLSPANIRQALAEERTRVTVEDETGWLARVVGPGSVSATRRVLGEPASVLAELDIWMQREECLQVQRQFPDRIVWEARTDWIGAVKRALRMGGGRPYHLWRTRQVAATVVPVDDAHVMVRLDADMTSHRTTHVRLGTATGAGGVALAGTLGAVGIVAHVATLAVLAAAAIPIGISAGVGYAVLRGHRGFVLRTKLALEQVLDRLEYTNVRKPASLLDALAGTRPLLR